MKRIIPAVASTNAVISGEFYGDRTFAAVHSYHLEISMSSVNFVSEITCSVISTIIFLSPAYMFCKKIESTVSACASHHVVMNIFQLFSATCATEVFKIASR